MSWLGFAHFVYSVRSDSLWQKSSGPKALGSVKDPNILKISLSAYRCVNTVLY